MSRFDKLREMNLAVSSKVVLSTEDGAEIVHYTGEDYEGETIRESGIANSLACLVTSQHLPNNAAIEELRNDGYLDDYERGSYEFEKYVTEAIAENGYELGLWKLIQSTMITSEDIPMSRQNWKSRLASCLLPTNKALICSAAGMWPSKPRWVP